MSYVPNEKLLSVDSLTLTVYTLKAQINTALITRDIFTEQEGFWKRAIIRNYQTTDDILYRQNPNDTLEVLPPLSERTLRGWGSYLEIQTIAVIPNGELEFDCVSVKNAMHEEFRSQYA